MNELEKEVICGQSDSERYPRLEKVRFYQKRKT